MGQNQVVTRYWEAPENQFHCRYVEVEKLFPWLEEYETLGNSFERQNDLAFRFANQRRGVWWERALLIAAEVDLMQRHGKALAHLMSARYATLSGRQDVAESLSSREPRIVQGMLILLPHMRSLQVNDTAWPEDEVLEPELWARFISHVLVKHPQLAVHVAKALNVYGSQATSAIPFVSRQLLSNNKEVVAQARIILLQIDPESLAKTLQIKADTELSPEQKLQLNEYFATTTGNDKGEKLYLNPQFSNQYEIILTIANEDALYLGISHNEEWALAEKVAQHADPAQWWPALSAAINEPTFGDSAYHLFIDKVGGLLYRKTGSPEIVKRLLADENPRIAVEMLQLMSRVDASIENLRVLDEPNVVDPQTLPAVFYQILLRHPNRYLEVIDGIGYYERHARSLAPKLAPHLLSSDPAIVVETRRVLTKIDPQLTASLNCTFSADDFDYYLMESVAPKTLNSQQRQLVKQYLATQKYP